MSSNTSVDIEEVNSCAYCRGDATQMCNGCHKAPDGFGEQVYATWYCGPDCQTKDWKKHKHSCQAARDRKSLHRAGATAQLAFYGYLETFFNLCITRLENRGEDLHVYLYNEDETHILSFPWAHFTNKQDKQAALTWMACRNALEFAHVLLEAMLPGQCSSRATIRKTTPGKGTPSSKSLKNSETYSVDITSAQCGHYDSIISWDLYVESRVDSIQEVQPLGSIRECRKRMDKATKTIEEEIAEDFAAAATSWQVANGPLNAMLKLREDHFVRKQAGLLDFIDRREREHKARLEEEQGVGSGEWGVGSAE